jgi:hypothetical protein
VVTTILETTVIVDLLRNYPPAETWIQAQTEASLAITPIIWMEVIGGGPTKVNVLDISDKITFPPYRLCGWAFSSLIPIRHNAAIPYFPEPRVSPWMK